MVNHPAYHLLQHSAHALLSSSQQLAPTLHPQFHPQTTLLLAYTTEPINYADVYIDDFMLISQPPAHTPLMNRVLHTIEEVFTDSPDTPRRHVISQSKLDKGDAAWSTKKRFLGWDIDTETMTLKLPQHRLDNLSQLIHMALQHKRISVRKWRQLLGTLRSTTPALYGATHCFSLLQHAMKCHKHGRLRLTHLLKETLRDWLTLANTACEHICSKV
jgi:hypothetical protein